MFLIAFKITFSQEFDLIDLDFSYNTNGNLFEGGGAGISDLNDDNLQDIVLISYDSIVVFKNNDSLDFEKVYSEKINKGSHSITIFDINNDGKKDLIISSNSLNDSTNNLQFYINQGEFKFSKINFLPTNNLNYTISQCYIADFENDNEIDIITSSWNAFKGKSISNNMLYDCNEFNKSNNSFKILNSSKKNLISKESYENENKTYSCFITDIYLENKKQIYASSDFNIPETILDIESNTDISNYLKTSSYYAMGVDIVDINNDLKKDILVTDMRPQNNENSKNFIFEKNYNWSKIQGECKEEFEKQEVRNTINLGTSSKYFLEVGQLFEMDATSWSWSIIAEDFDNNGEKDVLISNGYSNESQFEFDNLINQESSKKVLLNKDKLYTNFIFFQKDKKFLKKDFVKDTRNFNSRGVAAGDLNNDGKIDLVLNNYDSNSCILINISPDKNYLRIKLSALNNTAVINSNIIIYTNNINQLNELQPIKGFYSTSEDIIHFGLDTFPTVDSLLVIWNDGTFQKLYDVKANQVLEIEKGINLPKYDFSKKKEDSYFNKINLFKDVHIENEFEDFSIDPLLPNYYSRNGPGININDFNNDGKDDIIIGKATDDILYVYEQQENQSFNKKKLTENKTDNLGIGFVDNQFIIPPAGYETEQNFMQGYETKDSTFKNINNIKSSSSCVIFGDIDKDGQDEIFIGGRVNSWHYPEKAKSYLFSKNEGVYEDVTSEKLSHIGMVTSALFTDFNNDGWVDLIIVGEYMQPEFFINKNGSLEYFTNDLKFNQKLFGFWNSIIGTDINNDGLTDYILGNLGSNTRYKASQEFPLKLFAADFDSNNSLDIVSTFYEDGNLYPLKQLNAYKSRINGLARKYYRVSDYAKATFYDLFEEDKYKNMIELSAHETSSGVLVNKGNNQFEFQQLPQEAQYAPIFGMLSLDVNLDGNEDIITIGNFHHAEIERGAYTASNGWTFLGDGNGNFSTLDNLKSGFTVVNEGRSLAPIILNEKVIITATQNNDSTIFFELNGDYSPIKFPNNKDYALITLNNGKIKKTENYKGSGYLSNYISFILKSSAIESITFKKN